MGEDPSVLIPCAICGKALGGGGDRKLRDHQQRHICKQKRNSRLEIKRPKYRKSVPQRSERKKAKYTPKLLRCVICVDPVRNWIGNINYRSSGVLSTHQDGGQGTHPVNGEAIGRRKVSIITIFQSKVAEEKFELRRRAHRHAARLAQGPENYRAWLDAYLATEPLSNSTYKIRPKANDVAAYNSLLRLCQRFAYRHGFSQRVPSFTKLPSEELLATKASFAKEFWAEYGGYGRHEILNVDETAIYHDTPPHRTWALRGGSSKINTTQKHSVRLTTVLTIRADGKKLSLFFIVRGTPGGTIETEELPTYPKGHHYAVQKNAWMDAAAWEKYVTDCLKYEIEGPSVLLLDNFDAHVSEASKSLVAESACCAVCPRPANATAVCQPLDVGVMGPLKAKLRSLWLKAPTGTFSAVQKRRNMIERTIKAYEELQAARIVKSFEDVIPQVVELSDTSI